ncbi:HAD-IIIC family phosphatase [Mucilaginibacter lacusdianchii]|uniref:HAD-IIIC family phosphatase n=1 Tax=Mucilaginibacter lacusdianchii TaxID=2684211 RepID=UPI00131DAF3A|nr:HAD-IIIC family phosphatase [Mucilaginibacter sp. JXJ CY 39]
MTKDFSVLKKNLKKDFSGLKEVKVALLGDTATQFLVQGIRATGFDYGFDLQIYEADFNQIEQEVFDPSSNLYAYQPDVVIIFKSSHKLLSQYNKLSANKYNNLAGNELMTIESLITQITKRINSNIIFFNYPEINDSVFGNYANKSATSFLYQLRKLNYELMNLAIKYPNFHLLDISALQSQLSKSVLFHPSVYINSDMVLSIAGLPYVAARTLDLIGAMYGKFIKCVVLDLDNTLWGGIIGDDGLENIQLGSLGIGKAFTEFQYWLKKLKNRGIILTVCSKNTEHVAKEPFERHPDMVLHLDDIAVFVANWDNKADNIHLIQKTLNIGFDSMVFLDDNPFERNLVKESIPQLCVPELPEDPAEYLEYLYTLNLFETVSVSAEDAERTKQYQIEAQRTAIQQSFVNEDDYLKSLNMLSLVEPFNKFNTPRVAQLTQRSNQFNLRTIRYNEAEVEALTQSHTAFTFSFTLEDKFGDNGLICVIILKKEDEDTLFIDTWCMSCRVLKRKMEHFTLNTIVDCARLKGFAYIKGEYLPTAKNAMVKDHYANLGFEQCNGHWLLNISQYQNKDCFIKNKN